MIDSCYKILNDTEKLINFLFLFQRFIHLKPAIKICQNLIDLRKILFYFIFKYDKLQYCNYYL